MVVLMISTIVGVGTSSCTHTNTTQSFQLTGYDNLTIYVKQGNVQKLNSHYNFDDLATSGD